MLDTGVRFDHDLDRRCGGKLLPGYDMVSDDRGNSANDGNGRDADASDPGDWVTQADVGNNAAGCTPDRSRQLVARHADAGLIGAPTNNGVGMASVGRDVRVLPVRVLGKCGGYDSDIIAGMRWAAGLARAGRAGQPERRRGSST